ncbi:unnamed protein product [Closterium sp. NIES-64]|nr:unnamed protein product [Closterium sp. NIES-64]
MDDDPDPGDPGQGLEVGGQHGVLARGQQELQDGGQQLPHGGGQVQLQHGGTARAASVGAVSRADEEGTAVVGERAAVVAEVADGAATAAPDEVATEVRDRALARPAGAVEATAGAEESAAGAAETADGVARAAREAGSDWDAAVPPQPHDEVLPAPLRPTPMQHSRELSGAAKARAFLEEPCSPIINSQPLLPPLSPGPPSPADVHMSEALGHPMVTTALSQPIDPRLHPHRPTDHPTTSTVWPHSNRPPQQPDRNSPSQRRSTTEGESQRRGGLKFHTPTYVSPAALLPAPSAQPAPGDPHMGSSPSNPPPDEPSPLQAHGGGFTGAILPHQHLVAAQDDALPTKMEVVGVGVDRMTGEDEAALISHTPLPTTACSPTLLPTAQLRGLEGELRPVRQPHATQPHGPAVLHFSLTGPGHPPSLTDLEASKPSSGLRAAVSDLLAIRNTGIPLPTPTPPAPVVHAHEAPLMDLPLAAPILQEPFHPSPMETDLIFRPCASDADVGAPLLPASPHPSPSPAPPITTVDSSEGTATADPTDTATSPDEVVRCPTCLSSLAKRRALRHRMPFCHPADAARRAQALRDRASALPSLVEPRAQGMQFTDAQWHSLDSVQWSEYFAPERIHAHPLRRIPPRVLGGYLDILFAILARVSQDPEAPGPTLLLAAAPTLLLAPTTPPERSNTAAIAARIIRFGRGEWDELISEALHRRTPLPLQAAWHARTTTFSPTLDDRRIARCLRLAACNETSRACAAPESAEAAPDTENIVRHLRELGLAVQPHKCLVYGRDFVTSREVEAFTSLEIEVARRGLTVTGVPVGSDAFVERSLPERMERMGRVLPWLPRLRQPQTAARLLSACVSTRPQYLARTVPPTPAVHASFARWDERLGETFQQLLVPGTWTCREDVREAALDKIYLPICLGGFGIRRMERIAPARALESVRAHHTNPLHLANLTSLQGAGAGAWLTAVPYADSLRIPEAQWQVASAFHLGLPIPQLALAGRCSCGQAIDDLTVPHHEVRCSRFGVATVIHDTVKYMLREYASEVSFAVKVEDTTLILHLDAARARLQGLSGTGDGVPGQSGAPWGQQQQQGGLGRGAGGQEGREGQDGLASGGEEGGQQQQRQQQLGQQGQEGQTRRGEERGQHGQQQRGQQGQEGLASGGEESGQQQQQSQRQQQQQGQRQQVCRGEERGQKRQHQEGQQGQQGRQQEGQHGERREGQQGQPGWEEERIQQQQRRQ